LGKPFLVVNKVIRRFDTISNQLPCLPSKKILGEKSLDTSPSSWMETVDGLATKESLAYSVITKESKTLGESWMLPRRREFPI
jgi:hypothetical protein